MGTYQFSLILVQKTVRGATLKVHIFKKNPRDKKFYKFNLKKIVFSNIYFILNKIKILGNTSY